MLITFVIHCLSLVVFGKEVASIQAYTWNYEIPTGIKTHLL